MAVKIYSGSRTVQGAQYPIFTLAYYADVSLLTVVEDYVKRHSLVPKTIQEVVSEMLEDRRAAGCSQVHLRDLKMRLNRFAETFHGLASAVTAHQVREYLQGLKRKNGKPVSNRTRRNFQTVINSLFHFARMRRYVVREAVDEICEIGSPKSASS